MDSIQRLLFGWWVKSFEFSIHQTKRILQLVFELLLTPALGQQSESPSPSEPRLT